MKQKLFFFIILTSLAVLPGVSCFSIGSTGGESRVGVHVSTDTGQTFATSNRIAIPGSADGSLGRLSITDIIVDPNETDRLDVSTTKAGVYRSE